MPGDPYTPAPDSFHFFEPDFMRRSFQLRLGRIFAAAILWLSLPMAAATAQDQWVDEAFAAPFFCRADFVLDANTTALLRDLQELQKDLNATLQLNTGEKSVEVYLFRNARNYGNYLAPRVPEGFGRQALFVQGTDVGRVYTFLNPQFATDLRHECTHALLHTELAFLPFWLDEGLAEYFEMPAMKRAKGHPHLEALKWPARLRWKPDLERLEAKQRLPELTATDYRESWAWVHFMLHGPEGAHEVLVEYLQEIRASRPPGPLSVRLRRRIPDMERQLLLHIRDWSASRN